MRGIRNTVKAVIIENKRLLFNKMAENDTGEIYYNLPGGGQAPGETLAEALKRECLEEVGAEVAVGDLVMLRDYIGEHHKFAYKHQGVHLVEFMFTCRLLSPPCKEKASELDAHQDTEQPHRWMTFEEMQRENIYPKELRQAFDEELNLIGKAYLGDVN